jgi:hypothetical protein
MSAICMCARPSPLNVDAWPWYCRHCYKPNIATDAGAHGQPSPPSADAPPVTTAGAGRPTPPAPADLSPWDIDPADDYVPTWSAPEGERITAIFNTGHRP